MLWLICLLDAGHGGQDPGAVYKGRQEKDDNLKLALAVGKILEDNGINVSYTRTTDVYQTPFEKAQLANQAGVDYFISFHRNSSPKDNQYNGVEVLVYDKSGIKYQMAENIVGALWRTGIPGNRSERKAGLVVLRRTRWPALLSRKQVSLIQMRIINCLMKNSTRLPEALPKLYWEPWIRRQWRNLCITGYRQDLLGKGKMQIACCISFLRKDIRHFCCMRTDCIKYRPEHISRLGMQ